MQFSIDPARGHSGLGQDTALLSGMSCAHGLQGGAGLQRTQVLQVQHILGGLGRGRSRITCTVAAPERDPVRDLWSIRRRAESSLCGKAVCDHALSHPLREVFLDGVFSTLKCEGKGKPSVGWGSLLTCGDVEENPGPKASTTPTRKDKERQTRRDVVDEAGNSLTPQTQASEPQGRRACMFQCPFAECPESRRQLTADTLIRDLGRVHVQAGQGVPANALTALGHYVCTACRHLIRLGSVCPFCKAPEKKTPEAVVNGYAVPPSLPAPRAGTSLDNPAPTDLLPPLWDVL